MKNMKYENNRKKSPKQNIGFYIALVICVVAIAAAAWTTYGSVLKYSDLQPEESEQQSSKDIEAGNEVSGAKYENSSDDESTVTDKDANAGNSENSDESEEIPVKKTALDTTKTAPIEGGAVIKQFSPKNPIQSKTTSDWRTHNGIDISASNGTPVRAMTSGTIKSITNDPMLGNVICVNHVGGYTAYYCGLSDTPVVNEGNAVSTGDTIGYVSNVPSEMLDESHLHFAVMLENEYVDPSTLY